MLKIEILASGSKGNAYIVSDGNTNILLECGISWSEIQKKSGFRKFDACLVSHVHSDHSKALPNILKLGMPVLIPKHLAEETYHHNAIPCENNTRYGISNVIIQCFDVEHDVPNLGFCIDFTTNNKRERLVYITDTMYCKYTISNVTHWMIECNYSKDILDANVQSGKVNQDLRNRIVKSHMELETVKDMLRVNDLSKTEVIYLMHLSDTNSDKNRFKREIQVLTGKIVYIC
jgi:phosphoribosyl 1,2-cyclic phosphodiesterase